MIRVLALPLGTSNGTARVPVALSEVTKFAVPITVVGLAASYKLTERPTRSIGVLEAPFVIWRAICRRLISSLSAETVILVSSTPVTPALTIW